MRGQPALRLAILGVGGFYVASLLYHAVSIVMFPYDLNYGEGYVLNDALRLLRGEVPYTDVRQFPMVRSPYPPLFLLLDGLLTQVTGPSLAAGRLLSLASGLAIAAMLFAAVVRWPGASPSPSPSPVEGEGRQSSSRSAGPFGKLRAGSGGPPGTGGGQAPALRTIFQHPPGNVFFAATAVFLYLGSPHLYQWIGYSRVDLLANAFSLAAILVLLPSVTWSRVLVAALLCALALSTKQTAIAAPAAIALYLAVSLRGTGVFALVCFGVALALPIGLLTAAMAGISDGQYLDQVLFGNASNPFSLARLARFQAEFLSVHSVLVVVSLGYAVWRRTELPALYAATSFVGTFSVGNEGSSVNYFLEFLAAAILATAGAAHGFAHARAPAFVRASAPTLLAALQLGLFAHAPNAFGVWVSPFPPHGFTPSRADYDVSERLDALVAATPGDVLLEPAGFAVRNGRAVWVQPLDLRAEQHRGRWSPDVLNEAVRGHRFSLVVLSYGFLPLEVLRALDESYVQVERLSGANGLTYTVFRPEQ